MTAIITNMADYREKKRGTQDISILRTLTDAQVSANIGVSKLIDSGVINLEEIPEGLRNDLYPNGYDPENHPEDNYALLVEEAQRRGVATR